MQPYPPIPPIEDASDLLDGGHLWIQEQVDGSLLRFAVDDAGWIVFGDDERVYRDDDVPVQLRLAVRHVRETIDRSVLAESDLDEVTFYGVATHRRAIDYDWERTPPFLGVDVRVPDRGFPAPDVIERAFERLSLTPVNAFEKELPARHFDPDSYDVPRSAWYDGPPKGAVVRNKRGGRAILATPAVEPAAAASEGGEAPADPEAAASRYATPDRIERAIDGLARDRAADLDAVQDRVVDVVVREAYRPLLSGRGSDDVDAVLRAIRSRARRYLLEERDAER